MKLFALEKIQPGYVVVIEAGVIVAQGRLADLQRVAGDEAETTEIFVNPADVDEARARFLEKGRLN